MAELTDESTGRYIDIDDGGRPLRLYVNDAGEGRVGHRRHATCHRHQPATGVTAVLGHGSDPFRPGPHSRGRSDHATHTRLLTVLGALSQGLSR